MTPVFCCGFGCGVGATGHFASSGGMTSSTTTTRSGGRSARCNTSGTGFSANSPILSSTNIWVFRVYIYFATLPSGDAFLIRPNIVGGTIGLAFKQSDSKIYAATSATLPPTTFGATGVAVTTGQWYKCDVYVNTNANPWTVDAKVNDVSCGQATIAVAATASTTFIIGVETAVTSDVFWDDLLASQTIVDYPLPAGHILEFSPASDGTHTSTSTNITKGTVATPVGTAITSATTDSFEWVNGKPIGGGVTDNTRLINQQTISTAQYTEHGIEQTTEPTAPVAVEVIGVRREASTATGSSTFKVNDNGVEDTILAFSAGGSVTDVPFTKQYATMVGGGSWTLPRFKALKLRFGYSGDANPDQYLRGWMVEAEFSENKSSAPYHNKPMRVWSRRG